MFGISTGLAVVSAGISIMNTKDSIDAFGDILARFGNTSRVYKITNELLENQIEDLIKEGMFTVEEIEEIRQEALKK